MSLNTSIIGLCSINNLCCLIKANDVFQIDLSEAFFQSTFCLFSSSELRYADGL
jgi:hypothetical protein